ncbi:MAG: hypothetical protein IPK82_19225 [Polyangiaceae bacterium]|nr:hypothetical protein [Polyangiaceae bacterium]
MSKITLKLQDLKTGNTSFHEVEDEAAAIAYLTSRPKFTDVLGVVFEGLTREQNDRLRAAMRPLDDEERDLEAKLVVAARKAKEEAAARRLLEEQAAQAAHRHAVRHANPNRPMEVRYVFDLGVQVIDQADTREICQEARDAIEAWIIERNEWVKDRGQVVGEAKLVVWPGALPKPGTDRIQSGSFIPVTAPAPDEKAKA